MKFGDAEELFTKFRCAFYNGDFSKCRDLMKQIAEENRLETLKYFLEQAELALEVWEYGLIEAIPCKNLEIIKLIIDYIRKNKEEHEQERIDSSIVCAVQTVTDCEACNMLKSSEAVKMIKYIMDCYCN